MRRKLFFIAYGGGHINMLVPIIKRALKDDKFEVVVFGLTTAASVLESENIPFIGFKDFTYLVENDSWQEYGYELVGDNSSSTLVSYEESIAYHGVNFFELIQTFGKDEAGRKFSEGGRQCFYPIVFFKSILKEIKPDLVIATNSPRSEKAAIEAAGALEIKSICLVDMFALQEIKWIVQDSFATKVCVLNESVKKMFVSNGRASGDIVVTGNPAFDSLFSDSLVSASELMRNKLGLDSVGKLILYASQPEPVQHPFNDLKGDPELPRKIEQELRNFVRRNTNVHLVVRYHPSENIDFVEEPRVTLSEKGESLHQLLHAVDLVIVTASTVGFEANLIGKAVISVDCSIFTADAPFSSMGMSVGVSDIRLLCPAITALISDGERLNARQCKYNNFSAARNVFSVIESVLSPDVS